MRYAREIAQQRQGQVDLEVDAQADLQQHGSRWQEDRDNQPQDVEMFFMVAHDYPDVIRSKNDWYRLAASSSSP
jgi:hypothetical protein